eukprot:scaffold299487_cov15-Tisochrysis_lutea.AAC.1
MDSPATVINAAFVTYVVVNAVMKTFSQHVMPLCFSGLRNYITKIQKGEGQSGKQYSARYICSLNGPGTASNDVLTNDTVKECVAP